MLTRIGDYEMSEALLDKKFGYWQNQLLDLGKRNKMISYRETKGRWKYFRKTEDFKTDEV